MTAKLLVVYGFVADPSLLIMDFDKVIEFDPQTRVIGIVVATKSPGEFIYPNDIDEYPLQDRFELYLTTLVAEVIEVEGDLINPSKRHAWEKKLRRQQPMLMVGMKI
jgi:hypothetical protein